MPTACHIGEMARALGIGRFMVPGVAAGLSAFGGLVTDIRGEETATLHTSNRHFAVDAVNRTLATLSERARRFLERAGVPEAERRYEYAFQARYKYQSWEIEALFEPGECGLSAGDVPVLSTAFHDMHERIHTIREDDGEVEFTTWTVRAIGTGGGADAGPAATQGSGDLPERGRRSVYLGEERAFRSLPAYDGNAPAAGAEIAGPALIDSDTTTILLLAGQRARTDSHGNFHIFPDAATEGSGMAQTEERFDPLLMAVLSRRIEAIIREMSNTVMRASRSAVITNARDMSCGILTYDHRLISVEEAMPIHVSALELTTRPITALFDDVKEGDAFFNNSPYHGVTHHADMTLCVPVFAAGEPLFWVLSRSHHADVGAPEPTTYLPYAATLYQEGVHFPCVRIQEGREDKADIVRIGLQKIRAPNVWYGDYRAQVGACRIGERRLKALVEHYGIETVRAFVEAWMDYGARRAAAAIRELPAGTWRYTCTHDPIPGVAEEGIPITAQVTIEPEEGFITVDLRDNPDCVPGGVNLSEACAAGSCRIGVFYNLDPTIPHNDGSASRHQGVAAGRLRGRAADLPGGHLGRHHQRQRPPQSTPCSAASRRSARPTGWPKAAVISPLASA